MKIVFMGTPDFAAGALRAIIKAGHEVLLVVTQPDRAKGRSDRLIPSPVKEVALENNIEVFQPLKIKTPESVDFLRKYPADIFVVAAFGQIISKEILDMPRYGCVNIHASLLPKYRGASPIQRVILEGEEKTGVTIMQMDEGIDTGDMLLKKETEITGEDTFETLHDRLTEIGAEAICEALPLIEKGELVPEKQDDSQSCYAKLISKELGKIDFEKSAAVISRQVRGLNPWPSAYTRLSGKQLKIWKAYPAKDTDGKPIPSDKSLKPGEIVSVGKESFCVNTGDGILEVLQLQLEGKKAMSARDFLLGAKLERGNRLG
ncbi:MAG: methionyl-tRNA formyltransferase [Lachnospiraceae bacterium]|nr:methionyl-tRNA formyltransferase [Lachnospiraceae bacterium]